MVASAATENGIKQNVIANSARPNSAAAHHGQAPSSKIEKPLPNPYQIGWLFVQQYYTFLNESPERLHLFYNANSVWTHGKEAENCPSIIGQKAISSAIQALDLQNCQVFVSSVDSQASMSGGVIVQVLGEMSNNDDVCHKFSQTFFLAEKPEGYYVLNDIFRFLKEDIDVVGLGSGKDPNGNWQESGRDHVFNYQEKASAPAKHVAPVKQTASVPTPAPKSFVEESKPVVKPAHVESKPAPSTTTHIASQKPTVQPSTETQTPPKAQAVPEKVSVAPVAPVTAAGPARGPRAPSPSKKPAAPTAWSRIVSSPSDTPVAALTQNSAPVHTQAAPINAPAPTAKQIQKPTPQQKQTHKMKEDAIASDGFQNVPTRQRLDRRTTEEKEKSTIYLRSVPESVEKQAIYDAFMKAGQVLNVDMPPGKQIAFVTFKTPENAQACIGRTFSVITTTGKEINLLAEERKKPQNANGGGKGRGFGDSGYRGAGTGFRGRGGRGKPVGV